MSRPFQFKQFCITQEKSAMKVGFDGVLLGAWCDVSESMHCLDIGTGTGMIALMLAQRNPQAMVQAIEIDNAAFEEAQFNVSQSCFAERVQVVQGDFLAWNASEKFQHVVSNPPFYTESMASANESRSKARQAEYFPLETWLPKAKSLLAAGGKISFIYPAKELKLIERVAAASGLHAHRLCWVKPSPSKPSHRLLVELRAEEAPQVATSEINLRPDGSNDYSAEYMELCREFYLKF
ncbi:MAG: tRNA1(Val) (adenine(37)-N6)-methyltransferase [Mangrovibacterium sp.]